MHEEGSDHVGSRTSCSWLLSSDVPPSLLVLQQHGHPYISALVNDGTVSYDHDADGTHQELAGCQSGFRQAKHPTAARVLYRGKVRRRQPA